MLAELLERMLDYAQSPVEQKGECGSKSNSGAFTALILDTSLGQTQLTGTKNLAS